MKRFALAVASIALAFSLPAVAVGQVFPFSLDQLLDGIEVQSQPRQVPQDPPWQAPSARPQTSQQPTASADVRLVQSKLNELGYDAGAADGIMGPRTRQAIIEFQAARGEQPTGVLTAAQQQALVSAGSANPARPAPGAPQGGLTTAATDTATAFDILYDTDLPYNDYRHGMDDPSLDGVTLASCQASCAADGRCRAFTYNAAHEVCFLKSSAADPVPFDNAVSGIKRADDRAPGAGFSLATTGVGSSTGPPGGSSGIVAFPAARSVITPPRDGIRGVSPVLAGDRLLTGFPISHGQLQGEVVEIAHRDTRAAGANLALYFDLVALRQWPQLLDDPRVGFQYALRFLSPALQRTYLAECLFSCGSVPFAQWAGTNEFERQASYERFRQEIAPLLIAMAPDLPVRLVQVAEVELAPYDSAQQAFPLREGRGGPGNLFGTMDLAARVAFTFDFETPSAIPVPEAQAPAFLEPLQHQDRQAFVAFDILVGNPTIDGVFGPTLTVTLETQRLFADANLQQPIFDFPELSPAPVVVAGVPLGQGHVIHNYAGAPEGAAAATIRLGKLLALQGNPALLEADPAYFASLLPPELTAQYLDSHGRWVGRDEFERADSARRFMAEQGPVILGLIPPQGEIAITFLQSFAALDYVDGGFELRNVRWNDGGFADVGYLTVPEPLTYPDRLPMAEEQARTLRQIERERQAIPLLRTDYVIGGVTAGDAGGVVLDVAVTGLSVVIGAEATTPFATLPLPAGAITPDRQVAFAPLAVAELEPELFRLYAAREDPSLLEDPHFLEEGYLLRWIVEEELVDGRAPRTNWPGFYRADMLGSDTIEPGMLEVYRQSVAERSALLGAIIRISDIACPTRQCGPDAAGDGFTTSLGELPQNVPWSFARASADIDEDTLRLAGDPALPVAIRAMPSGETLPVYLLFMPDTHWQTMIHPGAPTDTSGMDVEFEITGIEVRRDPDLVLVGLRPHRAILHSASVGEHVISLQGGEIAAVGPFTYDIFGISLGMDRQQAEALLAERQGELDTAGLFTSSGAEAEAIRDYVIANNGFSSSGIDISAVFPDPAGQVRDSQAADDIERLLNEGTLLARHTTVPSSDPWDTTLAVLDQTAVFYDAEGRVVVVARYQDFEGPIDAEAARTQIVARYGEPQARLETSGMMVWIDDEAVRRALAEGHRPSDSCGFVFNSAEHRSLIPWRDQSSDPIADALTQIILPDLSGMTASCGRVLLARINETAVEFHLIDSEWAFERTSELIAADTAAAEQEAGKATQDLAF